MSGMFTPHKEEIIKLLRDAYTMAEVCKILNDKYQLYAPYTSFYHWLRYNDMIKYATKKSTGHKVVDAENYRKKE